MVAHQNGCAGASASSPAASGSIKDYLRFFGAFGVACDDAMVARWSANPLRMLWPEMDAKFVTSGGENGGPPTAAYRPVVVIAGS
jgi:hypothetical protein